MKKWWIWLIVLVVVVLIVIISFSYKYKPIEPTATPSPTPEEINELTIRAYLSNKYNPKTQCDLTIVSDAQENETIQKYPDIAEFVKEKYNLTKNSHIYSKIIDLLIFNLTKTDSEYNFRFIEAECPNAYKVEGKITIQENKIIDEIINRTLEPYQLPA